MLGGNVTANNSLASNIRLTQQLTRVPGSGQNQNDPCDESPLWSEELIKYVYVMNSESCVAELAELAEPTRRLQLPISLRDEYNFCLNNTYFFLKMLSASEH